MTDVHRRTYLAATGTVAAGMIGLAGCSGASAATGTLATQVTDQPGDIGDFESCVVTIQGIWVKPSGDEGEDSEDSEDGDDGESDAADNETASEGTEDNETAAETAVDESSARSYHEFDEPQEADLVELQNGNTQLIDERELDAGEYQFLQLDVTDVAGVLADGGDADVDTPGNAPLQFKESFEIREGETTTFTGDFTPVRRGRTGRYLLQPVARGTQVEYGETSQDGAA